MLEKNRGQPDTAGLNSTLDTNAQCTSQSGRSKLLFPNCPTLQVSNGGKSSAFSRGVVFSFHSGPQL